MAEQRVTDEQLAEWGAGRPVNLYDWPSIARALVAEVRASRAEQEALRKRVEQQRADLEHAFEQLHNAEQRIDKALAVCDEVYPDDARLVRAALTD